MIELLEYVMYTLLVLLHIIFAILTARYMYRNNFSGGPISIFLFGGNLWFIMIPMIFIAHCFGWVIDFITTPIEEE